MVNYKLIDMQIFSDKRGKLVSLESLKNIPFEIKRVYYIFDILPEEIRGQHAHKTLEQLVIAINGSCNFILDDGYKKETICLDRPDKALYIGKNVWREVKCFSQECKLVILANDYYNPKEYIKDYNEFIKNIKDKKI